MLKRRQLSLLHLLHNTLNAGVAITRHISFDERNVVLRELLADFNIVPYLVCRVLVSDDSEDVLLLPECGDDDGDADIAGSADYQDAFFATGCHGSR